MATREQIFRALFAIGAGATWGGVDGIPAGGQFVSSSRRLKNFADVDPSDQPAFFQVEGSEEMAQMAGLPPKDIPDVFWVAYHRAPDDQTPGSIMNNVILDAWRAAILPTPIDPGFRNARNTLGGLVYRAFISGRAFKDAGDLDQQGLLIVPLKVIIP